MADYYSIEEVTKILDKTEAEIREFVHDGKIREFYDNGTKMFNKEEVDALKIDLAPLSLDLDDTGIDGSSIKLSDTDAPDADESSIIGLAALDDTAENSKPETKTEFSLEESSLDNEMSSMIELSEADTNFGQTSSGINILEDSNDEFGSLEDSMADTKDSDAIDADDTDSIGDDNDDLGRLDADVNLDSFGSGSGLLDLSLQADDTSLGAVLDDILPSAGGEDAGIGEMDELGLADSGSNLESKPEETDPEKSENNLISGMLDSSNSDSFTAKEASHNVATVAVVPVDAASSAYGSVLFIPLVALLILAVSVFAAIRGIMPSIVKVIAANNLYITIGLVLFTVIASVVAIVMGQPKTAKPKKAAKPKKVKKAKKAKKKK